MSKQPPVDPPNYTAATYGAAATGGGGGGSGGSTAADTEVTVLLSIPKVAVSQIYEGETLVLEESKTLELSMIPAQPEPFLVIKCGECEVVLEPSSRIYHKGSGIIVPWLELPGALLFFDFSAGVEKDVKETLDTYLVAYTSMPAPEEGLRNQLALVDDTGAVVGELEVQQTDLLIAQDGKLGDGHGKDPVVVDIKSDGSVMVEAFKDSKIVQGGNYISGGIIYAGDYLGKSLLKGSDWFKTHTQATETDVQFSATTKANVRRIHTYTTHASKVSARTLGKVADLAERAGGRVLGGKKKSPASTTTTSNEKKQSEETATSASKKKPGFLTQSAYAVHNVWEALDSAGKGLLRDASVASSSVVQHRYGKEAGALATDLTGSVRNVALVYFDARGVGRTALLKGTIKGGVKARLSDGSTVVLKSDDEKAGAQAGSVTMAAAGTNKEKA